MPTEKRRGGWWWLIVLLNCAVRNAVKLFLLKRNLKKTMSAFVRAVVLKEADQAGEGLIPMNSDQNTSGVVCEKVSVRDLSRIISESSVFESFDCLKQPEIGIVKYRLTRR